RSARRQQPDEQHAGLHRLQHGRQGDLAGHPGGVRLHPNLQLLGRLLGLEPSASRTRTEEEFMRRSLRALVVATGLSMAACGGDIPTAEEEEATEQELVEACDPANTAIVSFFGQPGCVGKEYGGRQNGQRYSWDGRGCVARNWINIRIRSIKYSDGVC